MSESERRGVVVVGSFNVDQVFRMARFPAPGETCLGRYASGPGGKGFNQAVAAARQGAATVFVGALGDDALAALAIGLARAERIDARWQQVADAATGSAAIWLDGAAQNMIVVAPGANAALSSAHVEAQRAAFAGARVLLTQHEVATAASLAAQRLARDAGLLCLHNPAPALASAAALVGGCDILTPNESEFVALLAARGPAPAADALAGLDDAALHALARTLGVPTVVLTLGAGGAFVSHADPARLHDDAACYRVPAFAVDPVDTTGAGDAFNGALAARLALQPRVPLRAAVRYANAVAGMAVEAHGAAPAMPQRDAVTARFGAALEG
jgi:ribokinase